MKVSKMSIDLCRKFPDVTVLNLGGGFKVARMPNEVDTSLQNIGEPVKKTLEAFADETGRKLHLEIEPGTFLVARAGVLVSSVQDMVSTGEGGRHFLKLDSGMTEILRPQMYGAHHSMRVIRKTVVDHADATQRYVVVGHCCESGDIFTPKQHEPDAVDDRLLPRTTVGDLFVIEAAGACVVSQPSRSPCSYACSGLTPVSGIAHCRYCASMAAKHYNSYPEAPEVLLSPSGELYLIRARQAAEQIWANEVALPDGAI